MNFHSGFFLEFGLYFSCFNCLLKGLKIFFILVSISVVPQSVSECIFYVYYFFDKIYYFQLPAI